MNEQAMMEAARVSRFIEPAEYGRWKIKRFTVDPDECMVSQLKAMTDSGSREGKELRLKRTVPPGDYLCLMRKMTDAEKKDVEIGEIVDAVAPDDPEYVPIMSDTPAEILEHAHALEHATGKVLITGLGLGVVINALLAKPDVEHITVVEIDRDVIELTARYYEDDPRVQIVNMDALAFAKRYPSWHGRNVRFDYAWHDIWSHIASRNLNDDSLAEHGISYATMFQAYRPFTERQGAWGYPEAVAMSEVEDREEEAAIEWARQILGAPTLEARAALILDRMILMNVAMLNNDEPVPDDIRDFFVRNMGYGRTAMKIAETIDLDRVRGIRDHDMKPDPMARPNEDPEANVAKEVAHRRRGS